MTLVYEKLNRATIVVMSKTSINRALLVTFDQWSSIVYSNAAPASALTFESGAADGLVEGHK